MVLLYFTLFSYKDMFYEMEINVETTKVMKISRQSFPIQIMMDQKQPKNVEYYNYLCSMITNDKRRTQKIISKISIAKAAFNKKKPLFTSKFKEKISNMLHLA